MTMTAEQLKLLRKAAKLTQDQFAEALGMSRQQVNAMEAGRAAVEKRTALAAQLIAMMHVDPKGAERIMEKIVPSPKIGA